MPASIAVGSLVVLLFGVPTPSPARVELSDRCVTVGDAGVLYDCEEERDVFMSILLSHEGNFGECSEDCEQTFIVWCGDYWSGGHQTRYAILHYEAPGMNDRITLDQLARGAAGGMFRVRRELNCDFNPVDFGNSGECDALDCSPRCCREVSHFIRTTGGSPVLLDELKAFGTLPCFVLERHPYAAAPDAAR